MSTETPAPPLTAAQRRVLERVENPSITSPEQAAAVKHVGNCFLSACPRAGKTRTVGLRLAYHAAFHPDDSLAAVSHTNTAIDAIHAAARELTAVPEHYWVGTLHSFLLRYVVYPFGHLYMGCTYVPQVAGDERDRPDDIRDVAAHDDYPGCRVKAWKFDVHLGPHIPAAQRLATAAHGGHHRRRARRLGSRHEAGLLEARAALVLGRALGGLPRP